MEYTIELEIRTAIDPAMHCYLTTKISREISISAGNTVILSGDRFIVENVTHDFDRKETIIDFKRKVVNEVEFEHTVRYFVRKGWTK